MHSASSRSNRYVALAITLTALCAAAAPGNTQTKSAAPVKMKTITVSEGTDMEVTVSPDHKNMITDVQGLLFSLPMTGGPARQITTPDQEASHPDWSTKADLVAIQSYAGGTFHIWTMRPDGTALKQITTGHGDDREPRISPDGTTIAFTSDRAFKGNYDIWTVNVASGALKQITFAEADEFGPAWSPDGTKIAFVSGTGITGKTIESIDLTTGHQTTLVSSIVEGRVEAPSYSPDGKSLAYVQFHGVGMFMNTAQLLVTGTVTYAGKATDTFPFPATWLSGSELLYTGDGHILRTNLLAGSETPIPFNVAIKSIRPQYAHKVYDFDSTASHQVKGIYAPALSPNGRQVAFIAL